MLILVSHFKNANRVRSYLILLTDVARTLYKPFIWGLRVLAAVVALK